MANLTLHTVQFPGLSDTYVIPEEAADFSTTSTYNVGDYVIYQGSLYRCKVAVTTAGIWTSDSNWELTSISTELKNHKDNTSNPHSVTKTQVGLSAVANERQYSSSNKPPASNVTYSNSSSGLSATDAQTAIDELNSSKVSVVGFGYNFIRNWYFVGGGTTYGVFPVNTRGQTSNSNSNSFFIDNWRTRNSTGQNAQLISAGVKLTSSSTLTYLVQSLGATSQLIGKTCTLSCLTESGCYHNTFVPSVPVSSTNTYRAETEKGSVFMQVSSDGTIQIIMAAAENKNETFQAIKLELGNQQTLCYWADNQWNLTLIPEYDEEYLRCISNRNSSSGNAIDYYANQDLLIKQYGLGTYLSTAPCITVTDCNDVSITGWLAVKEGCSNGPSGINGNYSGMLYNVVRGTEYAYQEYYAPYDEKAFRRFRKNTSTWTAWKEIQAT